MKKDIQVLMLYYLGFNYFASNAIQGIANKPEGEELNVLRENIKGIEKELHSVKKRLNLTQYYNPRNLRENYNESTKRPHATEETTLRDEEREKGVVGDEKKPFKEGAKKVSQAACRCVCFVSKAMSNFVKTCYGKLRSLCCKKKELSTIKPDVHNQREGLDFGLY